MCVGLETEAAAEEIEEGGEEDHSARPDDKVESGDMEGAEEVDVALDKIGEGGKVRPSKDRSAAVTLETLKDA